MSATMHQQMRSKSLWIRKATMLIWLISMIVWSITAVNAQAIDHDTYINNLRQQIDQQIQQQSLWSSTKKTDTRRELLLDFCELVLDEGQFVHEANEWVFLYDPDQSVFLYTLCTSLDPWMFVRDFMDEFILLEWAYLKNTAISTSDFVSNKDCRPLSSLNKCNISTLLQWTMQPILNDYSIMMSTRAYGISTGNPDEKTTKSTAQQSATRPPAGTSPKQTTTIDGTAANEYATHYFDTILCDVGNNQDGSCSTFPKTYQYLSSRIKKQRNTIRKTEVLNINAIILAKDTIKKPEEKCVIGTGATADNKNIDLFACSYIPYEAPLHRHQNLMYNDTMRYTLAIEYYTAMTRHTTQYEEFGSTDNPLVGFKQQEQLLRDLTNDSVHIRRAVHTTNRIIANLINAHPQHIGRKMIEEWLQRLLVSLGSLYPVHVALLDWLTNVQATD